MRETEKERESVKGLVSFSRCVTVRRSAHVKERERETERERA